MNKPLSHSGGDIPIISAKKDPYEEFAKATGMTSFIVIGEVIDMDQKRAYSQFIPYRADVITQLGMLDYAKMLLNAQIAEGLKAEVAKQEDGRSDT